MNALDDIAGSQFSSIKNRIGEVNEESYYYKYTVIEGDALAEKLEFIFHEVQFEPTPEGGSKNKMTTNYHTKDDIVITEGNQGWQGKGPWHVQSCRSLPPKP